MQESYTKDGEEDKDEEILILDGLKAGDVHTCAWRNFGKLRYVVVWEIYSQKMKHLVFRDPKHVKKRTLPS